MNEPRSGFSGPQINSDKDNLLVRLKQAREYLGISQDKVAGYLGVPRSAVSEFESGKRNISAMELQKLARFYQRPVSWFTDNVVVGVPADVEFLARTASELSDNDRSELQKFAEFLKSKAGI